MVEVREAVKRLRRYDNGEDVDSVYPDLSQGYGPDRDCRIIATAYMDGLSGDDNVSITPEWLKDVAEPTRPGFYAVSIYAAVLEIELLGPAARWKSIMLTFVTDEGSVTLRTVQSRGELRRLVGVLGGELKEQGYG